MKEDFPIRFETYYFIQLLDSIRKFGEEKLGKGLQNDLNRFISFLFSEEDPVHGIEKLARLPGASDVSIFFMDILDGLSNYSPEEALRKIDDHAKDFLEIFMIMQQDPEWQNILANTVSAEEETVLTLQDFVRQEIQNKLKTLSEEKSGAHLPKLIQLLEKIGDEAVFQELMTNYQDVEAARETVTDLKNVWEIPREPEMLNGYMGQFQRNLEKLTRSFQQFATRDPEMFRAFCALETPPVVVSPGESLEEPEKLAELETIEDALSERETSPTPPTPEVSEEDKQLRYLLRDYIIHELESLTNEFEEKLQKFARDLENQERKEDVLEIFKITADMGKIHKYYGIEQTSQEIEEAFRNYLEEMKSPPPDLLEKVQRLYQAFREYVDMVLNEDEEGGLNLVAEARQALLNSLAVEKAPQFSLEDRETLQPLFEAWHRKYLGELKSLFKKFKGRKKEEQRDKIIPRLHHLKTWYEIWKLPSALAVIEHLHRVVNEQAEPATSKKKVIDSLLKLLADHPFTLTIEEVQERIGTTLEVPLEEKEEGVGEAAVEAAEKALEEVDVLSALEAFKEVTLRRLSRLVKAIRDESVPFPELIDRYFQRDLEFVMHNCRLIKNNSLEKLIDELITGRETLQKLPVERYEKARNDLDAFLTAFQKAIEQLPEAIATERIGEEWRALLEELTRLPETVAEAPAEIPEEEAAELSREKFIDEEIEAVFQQEARRYLEKISAYLDAWSQNLADRNSLEKLNTEAHTLKGSAQMLNHPVVATLAKYLENLSTLILEGELQPDSGAVELFGELTGLIRDSLEEKEVDLEQVKQQVNALLEKQPKAPAQPPEEKPHLMAEEKVEYLYLSESDSSLKEIFEEETRQNLETIEKTLELLKKYESDQVDFSSLEQAVHDFREASKMLGFKEIGDLLDIFLEITGLLNSQSGLEREQTIRQLTDALEVIKTFIREGKIEKTEYHNTLQELSYYLRSFAATASEPDKIESLTPPTYTEKPPVAEPAPQVLEAFLQEAREHLEDINFILMKMEKNPENDEFIHHLMRSLHTLKGSSAMVYLDQVEKLAHLSEDIVEKYLEKGEPFTQEVFDLFFSIVDEIEYIVDQLSEGQRGKTRNYQQLLSRLEQLYQDLTGIKREEAEEEEVVAVETKEPAPPPRSDTFVTEAAPEAPPSLKETYVRLRVQQLDSLLNEASELVINQTQLKTQLDKFKYYLPHIELESKNLQNIQWYLNTILDEERRLYESLQAQLKDHPTLKQKQEEQLENLRRVIQNLRLFSNKLMQTLQGIKESTRVYDESLQKITRLGAQIHGEIIQARLVPMSLLFRRFHRPLRDLARKFNKKIRLQLEGESTELDRTLIEELYEPILHILRNAIDHGIETPEERKKKGKPEEGIILLSATHDRNFVTLTVRDDGRGIDIEKVRQKAVALSLIKPEQAKALSEQEVLEFLFYPGFTTKEDVSELSGRGVGLDAVQRQVQKIKGDIRVQTQPDLGTQFTIRVPISLTVTQAMLVEISGYVYSIPLIQVEETLNVNLEHLKSRDERRYLLHRGIEIPVYHLSNLLQLHQVKSKPLALTGEYPAIIVQDEGKRVALLVDKIVQREEILIKSLGPGLQNVKFITGGSVLADGKVVLVLDVPEIIREIVSGRHHLNGGRSGKSGAREPLEPTAATSVAAQVYRRKKVVKGRKPRILVVDDSASIRKFLSNLLGLRGFEVEMAKNGFHALEFLNEQEFDLMITDLEMPQMSGYELIEQVRAEDRWENLPIVVLTGRASKHIQQLTLDLGADAFIIKPFKETELLDTIQIFLETGEK